MDDPDILKNRKEKFVQTPFGCPSDALIYGTISDIPVILLARHDRRHTTMPSNVNYRWLASYHIYIDLSLRLFKGEHLGFEAGRCNPHNCFDCYGFAARTYQTRRCCYTQQFHRQVSSYISCHINYIVQSV